MKYILLLLSLLVGMNSCKEDYEYDIAFSVPTALNGPENVLVDLDNQEKIILSWSGGEASDGSSVLYDVFFDKEEDFTKPFYSCKSDLGMREQLTLTSRDLNQIARQAGISPNASGTFMWTVRTSKGGNMKLAAISKKMTVTRPDVLDIPENLYVFGTALEDENKGYAMTKVGEGIFRVYISIPQNGDLFFADSKNPEMEGSIRYYYDSEAGLLKQGAGTTRVESQADAVDITVDLNTRTYTLEEHFQQPEKLYIQGNISEAGQEFSKKGDIFTLYTKFAASGNIYFTNLPNPVGEEVIRYYINDENKLVQGDKATFMNATSTEACANRITINAVARTMTVDEIGDIGLEWVNAMSPVDVSNPKFVYAGNGNFTMTFSIPENFQHIDEKNKGGNCAIDARYILRVVENGVLKRWGCSLTREENMTVQPYDRKHSSGVTYATYWVPVFEAGGIETEEIIISDYFLYQQMPQRWKANWFFKTEWAGTQRHAIIYTNDNNLMRLHIE